MTLLLYGIMRGITRTGGNDLADVPTGVAGQPVALSTHGRLAAAHTPLAGTQPPMALADIQTFNTVLQWLCRHTATVPLRYGSLCRDERALDRLLRTDAKHYRGLLKQIDGCVEMGIRIQGSPRETSLQAGANAGKNGDPAQTGQDYLRRRRKHYAAVDGHTDTVNTIVSTYKKTFKGLFKACTWDIISPTAPTDAATATPTLALALNFLIPRRRVEAFLSLFASVNARGPHHLRLSGPWPPYNFVTCRQSIDRLTRDRSG